MPFKLFVALYVSSIPNRVNFNTYTLESSYGKTSPGCVMIWFNLSKNSRLGDNSTSFYAIFAFNPSKVIDWLIDWLCTPFYFIFNKRTYTLFFSLTVPTQSSRTMSADSHPLQCLLTCVRWCVGAGKLDWFSFYIDYIGYLSDSLVSPVFTSFVVAIHWYLHIFAHPSLSCLLFGSTNEFNKRIDWAFDFLPMNMLILSCLLIDRHVCMPGPHACKMSITNAYLFTAISWRVIGSS